MDLKTLQKTVVSLGRKIKDRDELIDKIESLLEPYKDRYNYYGLAGINLDDGEYKLAYDYGSVEEACKEYIKESLWAFNPSFIANYTEVSEKVISKIQELYEDSNEVLEALITDIDGFIQDAINTDGAGHFLSTYDGKEIHITMPSEHDDIYLYRTN